MRRARVFFNTRLDTASANILPIVFSRGLSSACLRLSAKLKRIERIDPETAARISQLRHIVDFRNRIIHGYDTVDDAVVWGVVEKHLPLLVKEVVDLLNTDAAEFAPC